MPDPNAKPIEATPNELEMQAGEAFESWLWAWHRYASALELRDALRMAWYAGRAYERGD